MFRTQRNWWIALFNVAVFYSLSRYITILDDLVQTENKLAELESRSKKIK